jgi:hypothetical protein
MDLIGRKRGDFAQFKNGKKLPFDHKIFNIYDFRSKKKIKGIFQYPLSIYRFYFIFCKSIQHYKLKSHLNF